MKKKAIIISLKSQKITSMEKKLLRTQNPWGLILFKRNIKSLHQVKTLIKQIRKFTKDPKFPIMIDEEGRTFSRLSSVIKHDFTQKFFGNI